MNIVLDGLASADFIADLHDLEWFANVGLSSKWDNSARRIHSWAEWPGPEDPGVLALAGERFQTWRDALFERYQTKRDDLTLSTTWKETHDLVMQLAIPKVPQFSFDQDSWHAPTACIWSAAWAASVINCYLVYRQPIPEELARVWMWYERGHWPCGYVQAPKDGEPGQLLVY